MEGSTSAVEPDRRTLLAGLGAAALLPGVASAASAPVVRTTNGPLRGSVENGLSVFRGVRYGRAERFQAPLPPLRANEPVDAVAFGPSCPQKSPIKPTSEDCLFLNVWTPGADPRARRPVMLYIHGGGYINGSVAGPLYDGSHIAARGDVVVVTVNHRLNALGYLYLAPLDPRFPDSGNAGQLDIILALQWVRDNIAAFGGDPGKILVFGQSGGGAKIATLMGTPAARGLFHRAITMSGQQITASGPLNAGRRTQAYLAALGVDPKRLDTLLTLPTERLVEALSTPDPILPDSGLYFGPVLDQRVLLRHPFYPDANPQGLGIPMMLGNTHDETRAFVPESRLAGLDWDNLAAHLAPEMRVDVLPDYVVAQYRALYPQASPMEIFYAASTAGRSWRGQIIEAEARATAGAPAYVYQVDYRSPQAPARGTPHTMDIALAFGTLDAAGSLTGTGAVAEAASRRVMDRFIAFARTGDPNHPSLPYWPKYALPARSTMVFGTDVDVVVDDPRGAERRLFAAIPYIQAGS